MTPSQQAQVQKFAQLAAQSAQGLSGSYAPTKEDPKNAFLEKIRKIYMRRIELRIRLVMGIGGLVTFTFSPLIGFQVFRLWSWFGVVSPVREIGGLLVGIVAVAASFFSVIMSLDGDVAQRWARDWVEEREQK